MSNWRRRGRAAGIVGSALLLVACGVFDPGAAGRNSAPLSPASMATATSTPATSTGAALADAVTGEALVAQLRELEQITMAADGTRAAGSRGYAAAAAHIEEQLLATGFYEVQRQPFTIQRPHPGDSRLADANGRVINQVPLSFSPGTPTEGISGRLVEPARGDGCQGADWDPAVAGQFALVERGGCSFEQINRVAAAAGAATVIVTNNRDAGLYGTLNGMRPEYVPITGVTRSEGDRLRQQLADGEVALSFTFEQRIESFETFNLFAETRGGDGQEVVMAGAHLDSVPEGPGSNDNGSGSVVLLETALQLAQLGAVPHNKVRFAWWSGEEWGLLGSTHWVNGLVAADPAVIDRLAAYVNVDMIASPNYVIGVYDGDGATFPNEGLPTGSADLKRLYTSYFDAIGQAWVDIEMRSSSDHAAFMPSGVPVGGLFAGAGDAKSAAEEAIFGGQRNREYDPDYHGRNDTLANLSAVALEINGKASAHVIGTLADDTSMLERGPRTPTRADGFGYAGTV